MDGMAVKTLVVSLLMWLHGNTPFDIPPGQPEVRFVAHTVLEGMACQGRPCPILGFSPETEPDHIYLDRTVDVEHKVCERSILLHELVHYLQNHEGRFDDLPLAQRNQAREREALRVQETYLHQQGRGIRFIHGVALRGLAAPYC
ncbi:MAG: DUF6647 family protein [Alphaproteobacteria bacterium]